MKLPVQLTGSSKTFVRLALTCLLLLLGARVGHAQPQYVSIGISSPPPVNAAAGYVTVPVLLCTNTTQTITVQYHTQDGDAIAPDDYTTTSGTLVFAPGQTQANIVVPIVNHTD